MVGQLLPFFCLHLHVILLTSGQSRVWKRGGMRKVLSGVLCSWREFKYQGFYSSGACWFSPVLFGSWFQKEPSVLVVPLVSYWFLMEPKVRCWDPFFGILEGGVRDGEGKCLVEYFVVEGNSSTKAFTALVLAGSLQCC